MIIIVIIIKRTITKVAEYWFSLVTLLPYREQKLPVPRCSSKDTLAITIIVSSFQDLAVPKIPWQSWLLGGWAGGFQSSIIVQWHRYLGKRMMTTKQYNTNTQNYHHPRLDWKQCRQEMKLFPVWEKGHSFANDDYRDFRWDERDHGAVTVIGSIPGLVIVFLDK